MASKIPTELDATFERYGRTWIVKVVTDTFIIGRATDALLDAQGGPIRHSDIIKVDRL